MFPCNEAVKWVENRNKLTEQKEMLECVEYDLTMLKGSRAFTVVDVKEHTLLLEMISWECSDINNR